MIYPQKNKFIRWFFHTYILHLVKSNFKNVNYNAVAVDPGKSVLLLCNHFSWWDGFIMYYINFKLLKKRFHVMVIEETVKKVTFFKYMGAFSINKSSREMLASLDYAAQLLNDPENLVLIFPQGKLHSNFIDKIDFEKGLSKILKVANGKFQTVLAATFIENFQYRKPTANIFLKNTDAPADIATLQNIYQQHYNFSKLSLAQNVI